MQNFLKIILILCGFSIYINCNAQGIVNKWILGYTGGGGQIRIDFSNDSITSLDTVHIKMNFDDLNSSICDSHGNLLFYTNGGWIANAMNDTMVNGNNLAPGTYANNWKYDGFRIPQGAVIVPFPNDSSMYYLFHETVNLGPTGHVIATKDLYYSIIDMNQNNGLGAVTTKNSILLNDSLTIGALTICKHANGRDWWLLCHRALSDLFFEYLITPSGISGPYLQNIGGILQKGGPGQACFSPNGKKYARYIPNDDLDLYDFDRCTGLLSNRIHLVINDASLAGGVSFSGNSNFLYVSSEIYLFQVDLSDTNISTSLDTVAYFDGFSSPFPPFYTYFYLSQLAPDGKIYISSTNGVDYLHVINYPDSAGKACDVAQHGFYLKAYNAFTIPNHPNYFLRADSGSICDTVMLGIQNETITKSNDVLNIYPNPAQNYFYVNCKTQTNLKEPFILYNSFGKEVQRKKLLANAKTNLISTNELSNGVYFWKCHNLSGKLVVIK